MIDVKTELRHVGVLLEDQRKDTKLILEILGQHSKKWDEFSNMRMGFDNHEMRITHFPIFNSAQLLIIKQNRMTD
jgi:hypothetical protein